MKIEEKLFWVQTGYAFANADGRIETMRTYDSPLDEAEETLMEFGNEIDFFTVEDLSKAVIENDTRMYISGECYVRLIEG